MRTLLRAGAMSLTLFAAFAMAGCVTDPATGQVNVGASISQAVTGVGKTIANDLPSACAAAAALDSSFQTVVSTQASINKPVPTKVISDEQTAISALSVPCSNPSAVATPAGEIATVLGIYVSIAASLAAAQAASAAPAS
ncbi:MAG: hypothetical protein WDN29_16460 [Methylovirgula sp.]